MTKEEKPEEVSETLRAGSAKAFLDYWEHGGARVYAETHEERAWMAWQAAGKEIKELRSVIVAYDAVINSLSGEQVVKFARLIPPEFIKAMKSA